VSKLFDKVSDKCEKYDKEELDNFCELEDDSLALFNELKKDADADGYITREDYNLA